METSTNYVAPQKKESEDTVLQDYMVWLAKIAPKSALWATSIDTEKCVREGRL